ncbi:hypothetical protein ACFFRR_008128 [Megaselia abdita]
MKKRSETIGNSVNQLSPIIENALKEDYFEDVANKESRWKSDDDLEEYPSDYFQKHSVERVHSSQQPAEKPALTKGMKVDNIVKRLSMERISSPPPLTLGPSFSYIYPNNSNSFIEDSKRVSEPKLNDHQNNNRYAVVNKNRESSSASPRHRHHSENSYSPDNNNRYSIENKNRDRSSVSPWRQLSGPNDDVDSSKYSSRETSHSPPKNILKELNYNGSTRNGSRNELNSLSERRKNLENRISSRGQSVERDMSSPQTFHYKPRISEIEKKYSPERTHLDIIQSPSFKSTDLVKKKDYDPGSTHNLRRGKINGDHRSVKDYDPGSTNSLKKGRNNENHRSTNSLRKGRKQEDTTDYKNSLRREDSNQKLKRACESFLRKERSFAEELSGERKYKNSYRERSIDDGSLYDPRIDKYPVSTLSFNRKRDTLRKSESKESSPSSLKTKSILKRTIFGSNHSDKNKKSSKLEMHPQPAPRVIDYSEKNKKSSKLELPPQPAPRVIDYSTRRRLSTPKASPVLVRTLSEKKSRTPERQQKSPNSWFKSLTRTRSKSSEKQMKPATSMTFFGESDLDSIISPSGSTLTRPSNSNLAKRSNSNLTRHSNSNLTRQSNSNLPGQSYSNRNQRVSRSTQHLNGYSRASADEVDFGKRSREYESGSDELENAYNKRRSRSLSKDQMDRRRQYWEQGPPKPPRLRSNSRRRYMTSSEDDQSLNSQQSVVYLHAKTVGDIPQPYKYSSPRSDISKSIKTDGTVPMQRTVIKSFNVNAPWTPKKISDGYEIDYSADQDRVRFQLIVISGFLLINFMSFFLQRMKKHQI